MPGGTATSALGTLAALRHHRDVQLVLVAARHRRPPDPPFAPPLPVRHMPLPRAALYEAWHRVRLPPLEWKIGPIDVAHATGMAIPPTSAPLAVTVHDLEFLRTPGLATPRGQRFFERSWALTRRHAGLVLCPSDATRRDCVERGFPADRIRVVPWGVTPVEISAAEAALVRQRFGISDSFVLTVGTIEPRKNLATLAAALRTAEAAGVQLVVVGPSGWNTDAAALFSGLRDRVRLTGFVNVRELWALYRSAAVYCHPALAEGFGIPVLEAMAAGAPVVVARGSATEELAGAAGLAVDGTDAGALAAALVKVLSDTELARSMGARSRARAESFSWDRTAELTASAYAELKR